MVVVSGSEWWRGEVQVRRRRAKDTVRVQGGYSGDTVRVQWRYREETVRVHWGTVRIQ